mgnify:FL=1
MPIQQMLLGIPAATGGGGGGGSGELSVDLDGNDYLTVPSDSDLTLGTGDFAIEFWVWPDNFTNRGTFYDSRGASNNVGITIGHESSSGEIRVYMIAGSGSDIIVQSSDFNTNYWRHIAVTRNSGTVRLFIGGILKDTASSTSRDLNIDHAVNIGYKSFTGSGYNYFDGKISNLRVVKGSAVYTSTFTPSDTALTSITNTKLLCCNNSSVTGASTTPGTITASGDPTSSTDHPFAAFPPTGYLTNITNTKLLCCSSTSGVTATTTGTISAFGNTSVNTTTKPFSGGASVEFDGSADYMLTSSSSDYTFGTGDFTVEHWFYTDDWSTAQMIDARMFSASHTTNWCTYITSNSYRFFANGDKITGSSLSDNTWYHVAIVRYAGTTSLYINGVSQGTYSDSNDYDNTKITVGIHGPDQSSFAYDGLISDLRVVKGRAVY